MGHSAHTMTSFWNGKNAVITGGAGFVGIHLARRLLDLGASVIVLDDFSHGKNRDRRAEYVECDISIRGACYPHFRNAFAVFNLAAHVAGVLYNQSHQLEMFRDNLPLQVYPVSEAERAKVPHFLQVSSVCIYGEEYQNPAREENGWKGEPVSANAGYSWAKRTGEQAALLSDLPHVVIVRPSNMYGPYDYFDENGHVIPHLIDKSMNGAEYFEMFNDGASVREFLYVADGADGMLAALEHGAHRQAYNIGTNGETGISVRELIELTQRVCGTSKPVRSVTRAISDDPIRITDSRKLNALGWQAQVGLEYGLRETVKWRLAALS